MLNVIEDTLEYIDKHLDDKLSIEDLASRSGYSVYYFQRAFSATTGYGLKEYIRQRKLTRAAFDLLNTSKSIIDIALKYGFMTPESFSKAFKHQHDVSPSEFKKSNPTINATPPHKENYRKLERKLNVKIVELSEQKVVGIKHVISLENNENLVEIPKLWDALNNRKEDVTLFSINDGIVQGILGICKKISDDEMEYWIGVNANEEHSNYETFILPQSRYAVFEVIGPLPHSIQKAWAEIMSVWIATSGYEIDETLDFELYTDEDPFSEDLKSEIWIKLKK